MNSQARPSVSDLEIRSATRGDDPGVLDLMRSSLGWRDGDPNEDLFDWKHRQNPFGESASWVALHEGRVVGFRTFMRWQFLNDQGQVVRAVRAVDTATDPSYRGLGIFRSLTLRGVAELTLEGVDLVFNTPNDQSRPGYLKMGWSQVGRLPVGVLPAGLRSARRMIKARVPADLWSHPSHVGLDAADALSDTTLATSLIAHAPARGFRTHRTPQYLAWRTSLRSLHYRLLLASSDPSDGGILFRLRGRGTATEAAVVEQFVPNRRAGAMLLRRLLRLTCADYAVGLRSVVGYGMLPLPDQGPLLTTRPLAAAPPESGWQLTLADVELF